MDFDALETNSKEFLHLRLWQVMCCWTSLKLYYAEDRLSLLIIQYYNKHNCPLFCVLWSLCVTSRYHSPVPCKNMKPITTKTGCQLNSASPPSQPKPSLKWRTHRSTKKTDTIPAAAADPRAKRSVLGPSIASKQPTSSESAWICSYENPRLQELTGRFGGRAEVTWPGKRFVNCG